MAATPPAADQTQSTGNASRSSPDLDQFLVWQSNAGLATRQASEQIEDIRKVTFSISFILASSATGLSQCKRGDQKPAILQAAGNGQH